MATKCYYCRDYDNNHRGCDEFNEYSCTRDKGHKGKHVACGISTHRLIIW